MCSTLKHRLYVHNNLRTTVRTRNKIKQTNQLSKHNLDINIILAEIDMQHIKKKKKKDFHHRHKRNPKLIVQSKYFKTTLPINSVHSFSYLQFTF